LLPYELEYIPYTASHVLAQMQLLCFALLAFVWLMKSGLHPPEVRAVNLDSDWLYRRWLPSRITTITELVTLSWRRASDFVLNRMQSLRAAVLQFSQPRGLLARAWSVNSMVFIVTVLFGVLLLFNLQQLAG